MNCLPLANAWVQPRLLGGSVLLICFNVSCCSIMCICVLSSGDVHYDFRIKLCLVHLYLQLCIGEIMSYLHYCVCLCIVVEHILCCFIVLFVFVLYFVYPMMPCTLDYPFVIAPSDLCNVSCIKDILKSQIFESRRSWSIWYMIYGYNNMKYEYYIYRLSLEWANKSIIVTWID